MVYCNPEPCTLPTKVERQYSNAKELVEKFCSFYGITFNEIAKRSRKRELLYPRQMLMYILKNNTRLTYKQIGQMFDGRDHSTAMHAITVIDNLCFTDPQFNDEFIKVQLFTLTK